MNTLFPPNSVLVDIPAIPDTMQVDSHQQVMNRALVLIESFLLPSRRAGDDDEYEKIKLLPHNRLEVPVDRLEETLFQITLADHIRIMQTMYRDTHDSQCLASEFRIGSPNVKLPMKLLIEKIIEGKAKAISLIKIVYGSSSHALFKGYLDIANIYALQGMWPQVEEKINQIEECTKKLFPTDANTFSGKYSLARIASERLCCVYSSLRQHAIHHYGSIQKGYIKEVMMLLMQLFNRIESVESEDLLGHPSKFASALLTLFLRKDSSTNQANNNDDLRIRSKQEDYTTRSWGEVVEFLRFECEQIKVWMDAVEQVLLPQTKASLMFPFRLCDLQDKKIAHPVQLSQVLMTFPTSARVLAGSKLTKVLSTIKVEVPFLINTHNGSLIDLASTTSQKKTLFNVSHQQVNYELPITLEEFLALYVLSSSSIVEHQLDLLKVQLYTIQGIYAIYNDLLDEAEEHLKRALNMLESHGMEMEVIACELYNSIAQMMILKHRNWLTKRKINLREEVDEWIETDEGKRVLKTELKQLKKVYDYKHPLYVTTAEQEMRARNTVSKQRMAQLLDSSEETKRMSSILHAAYRYLVRSFEILESTHGTIHPAVATACLAVASVQNIIEDHDDTREWLMRALKNLEKCYPIPFRAISFTKIQLSHVLSKMGHDDQARMLLASAGTYHMDQAHLGLLELSTPSNQNSTAKHIKSNNSSNAPETSRTDETSKNHELHLKTLESSLNYSLVSPLILPNTALHEEITTAIDIMSRVMRLSTKRNEKWQAAIQAEDIAKLTEAAFGWDSSQCAEAFKQVGIRCAAVSDWPKAHKYLKRSLESMMLLYGKSDANTIEVAKLLHSAKKYRNEALQQSDPNNADDVDAAYYCDDLVKHVNDPENDKVLYKDGLEVLTTPRNVEIDRINVIQGDVFDLLAEGATSVQ